MYFESIENSDNVNEEYEKSDVSIPLTENTVIGKWDCEINNTHSLQEDESSSCKEEQEGEEETIATFVTASGQQLALYAVEDSDEIFAVAVYDESGEPPTNFQFLMKADVERLIGEGAVRTVKKPSQMKKRLLTTHPPLFLRKEGFEKANQQTHDKIIRETLINSEKCITQEEDGEMGYNCKIISNKSDSVNSTASSNEIYTAGDKDSDVTYVMMAEHSDVNQDICEQEDKLIERSTVQYILFEDDESDSELTFDEIQATLKNLNNSSRRTFKTTSPGRLSKQQNDYSHTKRDISRESPVTSLNLQCKMNNRTTISPENELDEQQCIIDGSINYSPTERETLNGSNTQPQLKIKRSRKQQLTSVNRDDGEIIIQPASVLNEEEIRKKRGRRRRRLPRARAAIDDAKRIKRITKRKKVVEVIELDIEKEEHRTKRNVVEITLDDSKDKYSSDKENEIIMVRDSDPDNEDDEDDDDDDDDEEEEEESSNLAKLSNVMRCEYCFKNFRQQRLFDTHLRICQKAPGNTLKVSEKKLKGKEIRKEYACKICQEKFDVVVALARHVRAEHSQKKKHKFTPVLQKVQDKSFSRSVEQQKQQIGKGSVDKDEIVNKEPMAFTGTVKRKRKQRGNRSWREPKKLSCADCGRWFPSSALLDTHSLQHGTKKSEQQLRKCQVCKKLIKSRLLLLRHLKMHSDAQSNTNPETLRRKLRTRQGTRKIVPLRKRGRPRKL